MTAKDLIQKMPDYLLEDAVGDTEAVVQYNLDEPLYQELRNGELHVFEGVTDNPDLIVTMNDEDFIALFQGKLNGMAAFMAGKVKVEGDMMLAQRLVGFVDQDKMNELA